MINYGGWVVGRGKHDLVKYLGQKACILSWKRKKCVMLTSVKWKKKKPQNKPMLSRAGQLPKSL